MFDLDTAFDDFINKLTQIIPLNKIADSDGLKHNIQQLLENYGFGDSGPECQLDVSLSGQTLKIMIKQVSGGKSIILNEDRIDVNDSLNVSELIEGLTEQMSSVEYHKS